MRIQYSNHPKQIADPTQRYSIFLFLKGLQMILVTIYSSEESGLVTLLFGDIMDAAGAE